jgi:hypothetical protein
VTDEEREELRLRYGLEPGVTRLRGKRHNEGEVGIFKEVLNQIGNYVYVAVKLVEPVELAGKGRKFYTGWEKTGVPTSGAD